MQKKCVRKIIFQKKLFSILGFFFKNLNQTLRPTKKFRNLRTLTLKIIANIHWQKYLLILCDNQYSFDLIYHGRLTEKSKIFRLIDHGQLARAENHAVAVNRPWSFNRVLD